MCMFTQLGPYLAHVKTSKISYNSEPGGVAKFVLVRRKDKKRTSASLPRRLERSMHAINVSIFISSCKSHVNQPSTSIHISTMLISQVIN
jgi:hypothetical protein